MQELPSNLQKDSVQQGQLELQLEKEIAKYSEDLINNEFIQIEIGGEKKLANTQNLIYNILLAFLLQFTIKLIHPEGLAIISGVQSDLDRIATNSRGKSEQERKECLQYKQSQQSIIKISKQQHIKSQREYFQNINNHLRYGDIFCLKTFSDSRQQNSLNFIRNNWQIYQFQLGEQLQIFLKRMEYKMLKFPTAFEVTYPQMKFYLTSLLSLFQQKTISQKIELVMKRKIIQNAYPSQKDLYAQLGELLEMKKEHFTDILLQKFVQQQKNNQNKHFLVEDKKRKIKAPLKKFVFQMPNFQRQVKVKNLLDKLSSSIHKTNGLWQQQQKLRSRKESYFLRIESEELGFCGCLGCSTFFIQEFDILSDSFQQPPLFLYPSVYYLKELQEDLLNKICALLNQGGGYILFGCQGSYRQAFAKGDIITKQKEQILKQFHSLTSSFYPKIEINRELVIQFVPMCQNPLKQTEENHGVNYLIEGRFVLRVLVKPFGGQFLYSWTNKDQHVFSILSQGVIEQLNSRDLLKTIKKKFHSHHLPQKLNKQQRLLMQRPFSYFDHKCCNSLKRQIRIRQKHSQNKQMEMASPQTQFECLSLLICKASHIPRIKELLRALKIRFIIQVDRFKSYKFSSTKYSALMYHNLTDEQTLQKIVLNQDFHFQNKPLLVITVTQYLKMVSNTNQTFTVSKDQFFNMENWLQKQFPTQKLQIWQFTTKEQKKELYLSTDSKLSRAFLYYVISHFNQKTVILKNPMNLQLISQSQRRLSFIEITQEYRENRISREQQSLKLVLNPNLQQKQLLPSKLPQSFPKKKTKYQQSIVSGRDRSHNRQKAYSWQLIG